MIEILFYVFAAVALGGGLGVVLSKNPVSSLIFMIFTLGSLAAIFILFEAHFLGAIQVLVYAGAIMVLFLFVIMLLNLGHDFEADLRRGVGALMGFAVCGLLGGLLARQLGGSGSDELLAGFGGPERIDALLAERGVVGAIAHPLFTDYVIPFEMTGILLLVAIVGALALAKKSV